MLAVGDQHRIVGVRKVEIHQFLCLFGKVEGDFQHFVDVSGDVPTAYGE